MESFEDSGSLCFAVLQARLLRFVQIKIHNGEFSERSLARILKVSQPQFHNVLKGARRLQPAFADQLLRHFGISCLTLCTDREIAEESSTRQRSFSFGDNPLSQGFFSDAQPVGSLCDDPAEPLPGRKRAASAPSKGNRRTKPALVPF